jgi:hypothetical protein
MVPGFIVVETLQVMYEALDASAGAPSPFAPGAVKTAHKSGSGLAAFHGGLLRAFTRLDPESGVNFTRENHRRTGSDSSCSQRLTETPISHLPAEIVYVFLRFGQQCISVPFAVRKGGAFDFTGDFAKVLLVSLAMNVVSSSRS